MGQVPVEKIPLILGRGRLAQHLCHFYRLQNLPFENWTRDQGEEKLKILLNQCSRLLLAISDDALVPVIETLLSQDKSRITHFSGARVIPGVACAHPLMTFGEKLQELDFYRKILFTLTPGVDFSQALPGWKNEYRFCADEDRALYHALCVLGGNLPFFLWKKMEEGLVDLGLPSEKIRFYIETLSKNYVEQGPKALTGPLARRDRGTIEANLKALESDPYEKIYRFFAEEALK